MNIDESAYKLELTFGKYKGYSLGYITEIDRGYIEWMKTTNGIPRIWSNAAKLVLNGEKIPLDGMTLKEYPAGKAKIFVANKKKELVGCTFPYDSELKERFQLCVDGVIWNKNEYQWEFHKSQLRPALYFFKTTTGFNASEEVKNWFVEILEHRHKLDKIRTQTEFDIEIPTLLPLYEYQVRDVVFGLATGGRWINGDSMGLGKLQPLDSNVLTSIGWKKMGDVELGDMVIGKDGNPTEVIGIFPNGFVDIYRVTFSDGSSTECGIDHLWAVNSASRNHLKSPHRVVSLQEIVSDGLLDKCGNSKYFIPMVSPVQFESVDRLPLDPYLLGVLLGDGCLQPSAVSVSSADEEIICEVKRLLPKDVKCKRKNKSYDYRLTGNQSGVNSLLNIIRELGLEDTKSYNKFIPNIYKYSTVENRLSILQGLMDTDGWCDKPKRNGTHIGYCTTSQQLALDVQEIVYSLGGICRINTKTPKYPHKGKILNGRLAYNLTLALPNEFNPFRLSRKREIYLGRCKYRPIRAIKSVEYVGKKEAQCIKVSNEDGLYVTDDYIVTHNTPTAIGFALVVGGKTLIICPKSVKIQWVEKILEFAGKETCVWGPKGPEGDVNAEFHVINYDNVNKFISEFNKLEFNVLICDEATKLKNYKSTRTKAIFGNWKERKKYPGLKIPYINLLTGTPILNSPMELFTLLSALDKKRFNSPFNFMRRYDGNVSSANLLELHERASELIIRHTKSQVAKHLKKPRDNVWVELEPSERKAYNNAVSELFKKWKLNGRPSAAHMPALRQLLFEYKFPRVIEFAEEMLESGRPILIFTIQQEHAERIANHFGERARLITGKVTDDKKRRQSIQDIIEGKAVVMVMTIIAGGMGVDGLQFAISDTLFVDRWWTPGDHEQAEDRTNRTGQENVASQWYMTVKGTYDEDMANVLVEKQKIIDLAVEGKIPEDSDLVDNARHGSIFKEVINRMVASRNLSFDEVDDEEAVE